MKLILPVLLALLAGCSYHVEPVEGLPAHHGKDGFINPYMGPFEKNVFSYLRMRYFGDDPFADHEQEAHRIPVVDNQGAHLAVDPSIPYLTWLGHSSFLFQYKGVNILTDPILSDRASPVSFAGPRRLVAMPIDIDRLPEIDLVVISHDHYDHLDTETIQRLSEDVTFLVPLRLGEWFAELGVPEDKIVEFDWWDERNFGPVTVTATPSQHWSGRGLFDRFKTLWAAWHIQVDNYSLWFGGDTGYNPHQFKEVGERWKRVDLGLIPIGAYAPRWFMEQQHVDPYDAVRIHQDINARQSIGMHWGTFQLSAEPIEEPKELLEKAVLEGRLQPQEFTTMAIGETRRLTPGMP